MFLDSRDLRLLAAQDFTVAEMARELGAPYAKVRRSVQILGIEVRQSPQGRPCKDPSLRAAKLAKAPKLPRMPKARKPPRINPNAERNAQMATMYRQGLTLEKIGASFDVTRERVRQILRAAGVDGEEGGMAKAKRSKDAAKQAKQDARYLVRHGLTHAQYKDSLKAGHVAVYRSQANAAKSRGIHWGLTLSQWLDIWTTSGKLAERGRGKGKYVMSRIKDEGGYAVGNVHIQLATKNSSEGLQKYADKNKDAPGVWCMYPGLSRPWVAKYGRITMGRFVTKAEAVAARHAYMTERGLSPGLSGRLGSGRGWTYDNRNRTRPYYVQVKGVKNVYCATEEEARSTYLTLVAELIARRAGSSATQPA